MKGDTRSTRPPHTPHPPGGDGPACVRCFPGGSLANKTARPCFRVYHGSWPVCLRRIPMPSCRATVPHGSLWPSLAWRVGMASGTQVYSAVLESRIHQCRACSLIHAGIGWALLGLVGFMHSAPMAMSTASEGRLGGTCGWHRQTACGLSRLPVQPAVTGQHSLSKVTEAAPPHGDAPLPRCFSTLLDLLGTLCRCAVSDWPVALIFAACVVAGPCAPAIVFLAVMMQTPTVAAAAKSGKRRFLLVDGREACAILFRCMPIHTPHALHVACVCSQHAVVAKAPVAPAADAAMANGVLFFNPQMRRTCSDPHMTAIMAETTITAVVRWTNLAAKLRKKKETTTREAGEQNTAAW